MYQATAEIVDGSKVFAGGKWLTCIGNKNVKVGDRIWTDGRCVYGYNKESQSPIVVAPPVKEEFGIPILMEEGYSTAKGQKVSKEFTFFKNSFLPANEIYARPGILATDCRFMINNSIDKIFVFNTNSESNRIAAANCDKFGNLYSLHFSAPGQHRYWLLGDVEGRGFSVAPTPTEDVKVTINTNNTVARTITLTNLVQEELRKACSLSPYIYRCGFQVGILSFIENESDWAFIFTVEADVFEIDYDWVMSIVQHYVPDSDIGHSDWRDAEWLWFTKREFHVGEGFFFDSNNTQKKIDEWRITLRRLPNEGAVFDPVFVTFNFNNILGLKLPIQDGYYFTIDSLTPAESLSLPKFALHSLFSPTGNKILTAEFPLDTYFAICKLNSSRFLLSAQPTFFSFAAQYNFQWNYERVYHNNIGLFFLENNKLQRVSDSEDFSLYALNQRLRPMKKYKHWWERIQIFDQ